MEADDLYGLPLEAFIPERGTLAKTLRADGRRDEAAEVAKLRKPSVAAWAVNQLVRTQGKVVKKLYGAGDALRKAQEKLLAGSGDGRALRSAGERERAAVDGLVELARGLLSSDGHELSPAVVERVADTLHAAALDAGAREQVRAGRLEKELRHVGLGLGEGAFAASAPAAGTPKPTAPPRRTTRKPAPAKRADPRREDRERAEKRKTARVAEAQARRRGERADSALRAAEERRERAASALEDADAALEAARKEVKDAAAAHRRAKQELDGA
ncbi:MAG: hypothetical protein QOG15_2922 [Solirubrobacteraceae bacterium]|jgi:hypothetical protein|nr:hypothetical protein [Solirubrobacteraceae bacterium]